MDDVPPPLRLHRALAWRKLYKSSMTPAQRRRMSYLIRVIVATEELGINGGNAAADALAMVLHLDGLRGDGVDETAAWCELLCRTGYSPPMPPPELLTAPDPRPGFYYVVAVARNVIEAPEHSYYLHGPLTSYEAAEAARSDVRSLWIDRTEAAYYARWGIARLPPERNPATLPIGSFDEAMLTEWRAKRAALPQRSSKPTAKTRRAKA
jgi:hypothetical protein